MSALTSRGGRTKVELDFDRSAPYEDEERSYKGAGWVLFATIMLVMGAVLSIIWVSRQCRVRISSSPEPRTSSVT
jgi:hypothetical protein